MTVNQQANTCANGKGRLCSLTDPSGGTTWAYDLKGRITAKTQTVAAVGAAPARSFTISYSYNAAGQLATVTLPSGEMLTYHHNGNNQLAGLTTTPVGGSPLTPGFPIPGERSWPTLTFL